MTDEFDVDLDVPTNVVFGVEVPAVVFDDRPAPPLELYVDELRAAARLVALGRLDTLNKLNPASTPKERADREREVEDRVARAEEYARWRWHGYKANEIEAL